MQQIYAKVKRSSKYFSQNQVAKDRGEFPFPVKIIGSVKEYCVQGGPGGQYRLADVNLFIVDEGREVRIR